MKRVFTDERFPGCEIVNNEQPVFEVFENGQLVSSFDSWDQPDGTMSEACAQRRAADFFNRLAQQEAQVIEVAEGKKVPSMEIDRWMSKATVESTPERQQALRRHVFNLLRQEESLAEAVVNHLIEAW